MTADHTASTTPSPANVVVLSHDRERIIREIATRLSFESRGTLSMLGDGTLLYAEQSLDAAYAGLTSLWCIAAAVSAFLIARHRPLYPWWIAGFIAVVIAFTIPLFFFVLWRRTTTTVIALDEVDGGTRLSVLSPDRPPSALLRLLNNVTRDLA